MPRIELGHSQVQGPPLATPRGKGATAGRARQQHLLHRTLRANQCPASRFDVLIGTRVFKNTLLNKRWLEQGTTPGEPLHERLQHTGFQPANCFMAFYGLGRHY